MIWGSAVMALEEPKYTIIKQTNDYEIRKYDDRLAVETLEGSGENRAFSLLFKYISGANELNSKVAMTIPVTQSTRIDMTAPVTQEEVNGDHVMRFFCLPNLPWKMHHAQRLVLSGLYL